MKHVSENNLQTIAECVKGDITQLATQTNQTFNEVYDNLETLDQKTTFEYVEDEEMLRIPTTVSTGTE